MKRLLIGAVAAAAFAVVGATAQAQTYGFGTMGEGTNSFSTASAISKLMVEKLGLQSRLQPTGGTSTFPSE